MHGAVQQRLVPPKEKEMTTVYTFNVLAIDHAGAKIKRSNDAIDTPE